MIRVRINKKPEDLKIGAIIGRAYLCNDLNIIDGHTSLWLGNTGVTDKITDIVDFYKDIVIDKVGIDFIIFQISWRNRGILDNLFYPNDKILYLVENDEKIKGSGSLVLKEFNSLNHKKRLCAKDPWGRISYSKQLDLVAEGITIELPLSTDKSFDRYTLEL